MQYMVVSRWAGFWGGWGSEGDLGEVINTHAGQGWKLKDTEASIFAWFWFIPRHKVLMIFERPSTGVPAQPSEAPSSSAS